MNVMVMRYLFFCTWYKKRETFWYQRKKEQLFMHPSLVLNNNKTHKEEEYDKNQNHLSAFLLSSHKSQQELLILFYVLLNVHAPAPAGMLPFSLKLFFFLSFIHLFIQGHHLSLRHKTHVPVLSSPMYLCLEQLNNEATAHWRLSCCPEHLHIEMMLTTIWRLCNSSTKSS